MQNQPNSTSLIYSKKTAMEKKTKLPKSIKFLSKKLKKVPHLNLNGSITPSRLRSACKYPKTPSFDERDPDIEQQTDNRAATLSDIERFVFENFHSLYIKDTNNSSTSTFTKPRAMMHGDFTTKSASPASMTSPSTTDDISEKEAGVGIVTFSVDPYEDFRSSIKNMVEAHHPDESQSLDWDFMKELLFCYLELNDQSMHKHVLGAFIDIAAGFRRSRVSVVSKRTVPVNTRRQKVAQRDEIPNSPGRHFPADCENKQNGFGSF
ncbi:Transcription repressor OFP14 [Rhynchospora pubera]|uniref:Transcription repressor n=1 Tax=Rhynchospora pubera TaxID=906938 RepID=A0AAV8DHA9_9POAL|nr:Transcription repressor OFP14 [Rhynchospora pubera]